MSLPQHASAGLLSAGQLSSHGIMGFTVSMQVSLHMYAAKQNHQLST